MDELGKIMNLSVVQEYMKVMRGGLRHTFPSLNEDELQKAIEWSVSQRYKNMSASIDNNYTMTRMDGTVADVLAYLEKMEPIITSSGVLFRKHKEMDNPLSRTIMGFIKKRKVYKGLMFESPKGSSQFAKYNLLQLLEKLNACNGPLYW